MDSRKQAGISHRFLLGTISGLGLAWATVATGNATVSEDTTESPPAGAVTRYLGHSQASVRYEMTQGGWSRTAARSVAPVPAPIAAAGNATLCGGAGVSWVGQSLPDGEQGTLFFDWFGRSSSINDHGRVAFAYYVDGAARNQGIFTADADGLRIVALGCGGYGGSGNTGDCGDPAPTGGTFGGFFIDTALTPSINNQGDVLFIADIHGGDTHRGLFLYRAAGDDIIKIAAMGDPAPGGGVLTEIGPGNINNHGVVVFLARTDATDLFDPADIMKWEDDKLSVYVADGDAVPGGGSFAFLATELLGYADDTMIPGGPAPGINDHGQVAFRSNVADGQAHAGLFLSEDGEHEWLIMHGGPTPVGGGYFDFYAPLLNNAGQVAFYADIMDGDDFNNGWVVGSAGDWRQALLAHEAIDDGLVVGMAVSRNPINALNDNGDLALWVQREMPDSSWRHSLVISRADNQRRVIVEQGQITPAGGFFGGMDAWPAHNNTGQLRLGAGTPGIPGQPVTEFVLDLCPPPPDALFGDRFEQLD